MAGPRTVTGSARRLPVVVVEAEQGLDPAAVIADAAGVDAVGTVWMLDDPASDQDWSSRGVEVLEWNGTWGDAHAQVLAAASTAAEGPPAVIAVPGELWSLAVAYDTARWRRSKAYDPDAVPQHDWDRIRERWQSLLTVPRRHPVVLAVLVRSFPLDDGRWKPLTDDRLVAATAGVWLRLHRGEPDPWLEIVAAPTLGLFSEQIDAADLFDVLLDGAAHRPPIEPNPGIPVAHAKDQLLAAVARHLRQSARNADTIDETKRLWSAAGLADQRGEITSSQLEGVLALVGTPPDPDPDQTATSPPPEGSEGGSGGADNGGAPPHVDGTTPPDSPSSHQRPSAEAAGDEAGSDPAPGSEPATRPDDDEATEAPDEGEAA